MDKEKIGTLGGQAVIEGVMMRTKDTYALAVRGTDGNSSSNVICTTDIHVNRLLCMYTL